MLNKAWFEYERREIYAMRCTCFIQLYYKSCARSFTASKLGETPFTARARPLVRRTSRHRLARHDLEWLQLTSFRRIIVSWEFPQKCCMRPPSRIAIEGKLLRDLDDIWRFNQPLTLSNLIQIHINII